MIAPMPAPLHGIPFDVPCPQHAGRRNHDAFDCATCARWRTRERREKIKQGR